MRPISPLVAAVLLLLPAQTTGQATDLKGDFVRALGRFGLALEGRHGDERDAVRSGLDELERALAQWDAVIRSYESAMAAEIGAADAALAARMRMAIGAVYLDRHRIDDALREFMAARTLAPNRADVHGILGTIYGQVVGDRAAAGDALRTAAALDPSNPIRAYLLARHLSAAGRSDEAAAARRTFLDHPNLRAAMARGTAVATPFARVELVPEAANLEPFFPPVLYASGFDLLARGEYVRAVAAFREAAQRDPLLTDAGPHRELVHQAANSSREGLVARAVEELTRAIELAPGRAEPHRLIGLAYAAAERYDEAAAAFRQALTLDPRDERARLSLAGMFVDAARFDDARQVFTETLTTLPRSGRARYGLARLDQREGKADDAIRGLEAAAGFNPLLGLNGIYETIGSLHAPRQNFDAALAAYEIRATLHPNDPEAHVDLGDINMRLGRHDEALAEFSVALLIDPKHARAAALMAQTYLRETNYAAAVTSAERALAADPTRSEARYALATALLRLGRAEDGKRELETFQRDQAEAAARRARLFEIEGLRRDAALSAAEGKSEQTVALLQKVLALDPGAGSHLELGLALLDANRPSEALARLTDAARLGASYEVHRYLAMAYRALGRIAESDREQAVYDEMRRDALKRRSAGQ